MKERRAWDEKKVKALISATLTTCVPITTCLMALWDCTTVHCANLLFTYVLTYWTTAGMSYIGTWCNLSYKQVFQFDHLYISSAFAVSQCMFFKCSVLFIVNSISPLCLLCLLLILYTSVMYQLSCSVLVMLILTLAMTLDATVNWIWYLIDWLGLVSLAILWLHDRCDKNLPICWQACKWLQTLFYNIGSISANFSCQFTNWPVNGNPLLVITDYNLQPVLCLEKWASCTLCDKIAKSQPNRMQLWSDSFKCSCDHIWKYLRFTQLLIIVLVTGHHSF